MIAKWASGRVTYASRMPNITEILKAHLTLLATNDIGHRFNLLRKIHLPIVADRKKEKKESEFSINIINAIDGN